MTIYVSSDDTLDTIPSDREAAEPPRQPRPLAAARSSDDSASLSGTALVVEDNVIIALDAEGLLSSMGATDVLMASSTAEALSLLDVKLGQETSERIAERLDELGEPFIFATGYGKRAALSDRFPDAPVLSKPYDTAMVRRALHDMATAADRTDTVS